MWAISDEVVMVQEVGYLITVKARFGLLLYKLMLSLHKVVFFGLILIRFTQ
jgi:hypothetical protein